MGWKLEDLAEQIINKKIVGVSISTFQSPSWKTPPIEFAGGDEALEQIGRESEQSKAEREAVEPYEQAEADGGSRSIRLILGGGLVVNLEAEWWEAGQGHLSISIRKG